MKIDFSNAKSAKENNDYLYKLEALSTSLNAAGVAVGITSVLAFGAVTAGMGPAIVAGAAVAATIATHTATGVAFSAAGIGLALAKNQAENSQRENAKGTVRDLGREATINATGNNVMGTEQAGMAAGMEGGKAVLGGVLAGTIGAIFATISLKYNRDNFLKLAEGRKAIMANFNSIGVTLMEVKSQLIFLGNAEKSVDDLIKPILPDIDKTTVKIQKITGTYKVLPTLKN